MKSNLVILLDAGHGGIIDGQYVTPGKRSPIWEDGTQYFEGVGNREIRDFLIKFLKADNIRFKIINEGNKDMPLSERVNIANAYHKKYKNTLLISIHSDAASNPQAHGWSCFTSEGETESDKYASALYEEIEKFYGSENVRLRTDNSDGDPDKEKDFYILRNTIGPAILSENFFMTNEKECRYLMSKEGKRQIAHIHYLMIKRFVSNENQ